MYEFYKIMNKFLYELGKLLFVGGIFTLFGGLVYFLLMPLIYSFSEIDNKLTNLEVISYLVYSVTAIITGFSICGKYEKYFPKKKNIKSISDSDTVNNTDMNISNNVNGFKNDK